MIRLIYLILCFVAATGFKRSLLNKGCYMLLNPKTLSLGDEGSYYKDFYIYGVKNHKKECYDQCRYGINNRYVFMFAADECVCLDEKLYSALKKETKFLPNEAFCNTECKEWPDNKYKCGGTVKKSWMTPERSYGQLYELPLHFKGLYKFAELDTPLDAERKPSGFVGCFTNDATKPLSLKETTRFHNNYISNINDGYYNCYLKCQSQSNARYVIMWKGDECACIDEEGMKKLSQDYPKVDESKCNRLCKNWPEATHLCGGINTAEREKLPGLQGFGSVYKLPSNPGSGTSDQKDKAVTEKTSSESNANEKISTETNANIKSDIIATTTAEPKSPVDSDIYHVGCFSFRPARITSLGQSESRYKSFYIYNVNDHKEQCFMQCRYGENNIYVMMVGIDQCVCLDSFTYKHIQEDTAEVPSTKCNTECKKWPQNVYTCGGSASNPTVMPSTETMGDLYKLPTFNKWLYLREKTRPIQDWSRVSVGYKGCYRNDAFVHLSLSAVPEYKNHYVHHVTNSYIDCYKHCEENPKVDYVLMWKGDECVCLNEAAFKKFTDDYRHVDDYHCNRECIQWVESRNTCGGITTYTVRGTLYFKGLGSMYQLPERKRETFVKDEVVISTEEPPTVKTTEIAYEVQTTPVSVPEMQSITTTEFVSEFDKAIGKTASHAKKESSNDKGLDTETAADKKLTQPTQASGYPVQIRHNVQQKFNGHEQKIVILDEYIIND